jgi:hypothetical protein
MRLNTPKLTPKLCIPVSDVGARKILLDYLSILLVACICSYSADRCPVDRQTLNFHLLIIELSSMSVGSPG